MVLLLGGVGGSIMTWNIGIGCGLTTSVTLLKKEVQRNAQSASDFGMSRIFSFSYEVRLLC